jgi:leucine dehydrogenase
MSKDALQAKGPERIVRLTDEGSGLNGFIVLHSTVLGPAAGGCRFWRYATGDEAVADALRLAEGMTLKNALAGLPFGGGKAVIQAPLGPYDRPALFRAFGRAVDELESQYVTAEDVGTNVEDMVYVAKETRFVAGLPQTTAKPGGDPSYWTARGVLLAMRIAAERHLGKDLSKTTVAVQGLGHVGWTLCQLLYASGARLLVSDIRSEIAIKAQQQLNATVLAGTEILEASADVFAPCALGGILNRDSIKRLRAKIVCGAANNQLASPGDGRMLASRGVLYAPDYLVNAGGIINVAGEYFRWTQQRVRERVDLIGPRLAQVLDLAERRNIPTSEAAESLARMVIAREEQVLSFTGTAPEVQGSTPTSLQSNTG